MDGKIRGKKQVRSRRNRAIHEDGKSEKAWKESSEGVDIAPVCGALDGVVVSVTVPRCADGSGDRRPVSRWAAWRGR